MRNKRFNLIDSRTLQEHINDDDWVVIDCRYQLDNPKAGFNAYKNGHIPNALYANLDNDLARNPGPLDGRHPLPIPKLFSKTLGKWGISNTSTVVAYDDIGGAFAARLWWMLGWIGHKNNYLLDGGIQNWQESGFELAKGIVHPVSAKFTIGKINEHWVINKDDLLSEMENGAILLDARSEDRFSGQNEPIDSIAGHIPGALNFPYTLALSSNGKFLECAKLKHVLKNHLRRQTNLIAMCGSGVTACHLAFTADVAGLDNLRIYIGSWSEWIKDVNCPISKSD
ncbi:MAG: sulfurtransferase [Rhodospirillaceae bacterium]|nr:sulfurtransferase [Rhodospirillaceae bacterium]